MKRKISIIALCAFIFFINSCKKDSRNFSNKSDLGNQSNIPVGYTMTTVGLIADSNITLVPAGYKLSFLKGHLLKVQTASGKIIKDLGTVMPNMINTNSSSSQLHSTYKNLNDSKHQTVFGNSGQTNNYVTFAQWNNTTSFPITNFNTNFTVPNAPTNQSNKLYAIWPGLQPSSTTYPLIQPLLIWGNSQGAIGGGQYWTIVSYFIWQDANGTLHAGISTPVHNVAPGTSLQAQITSTGQQGDQSYNWTSQFVGLTSLSISENTSYNSAGSGTVTAPFIPAMNYAEEVLEIPGQPYITSVDQYPNQQYLNLNSIGITTGFGSNASNPTLNWQSSSTNGLPNGAALGENTSIVNSSQINIYFGSPIITFNVSSKNTSQTTGYSMSDGSQNIASGRTIGQNITNTIQCQFGAYSQQNPYTQIPNNTNSTIIMTVINGYRPVNAVLNTSTGTNSGTINGSTITFYNVNISTAPQTINIVIQ